MRTPVRITAPSEQPITLAEAKAQCRVRTADFDAEIQGFLDAAVDHLDGWRGTLGRCLISQGWRQPYRAFARRLVLPFPDVSAVTLNYTDVDGSEQTVLPENYDVIASFGGVMVVLKPSFDVPDTMDEDATPVWVDFTAGYGSAADVPSGIKQAIKLLVSHWFVHREAVDQPMQSLPMGLDALTKPHKWKRY